MNRALGVPHFTARTPDEYVDMAVALHAKRHGYSKWLSEDLKRKRLSSPLFDTVMSRAWPHAFRLLVQIFGFRVLRREAWSRRWKRP